MRSITVTLFLALIASGTVGLVTYQSQQGNFNAIFGKPPTAVGLLLYDNFEAEDVVRIEIRSSTVEGVFEREGKQWQGLTPWKDRMDPVAAAAIIRFTRGMRIEDHSPSNKINRRKLHLNRRSLEIRLVGAKGEALAYYRMGRISSWKAEVDNVEQPMSTVFIYPKDDPDNKSVYLCTGDISPLFQENLKLLRDHRPLYFNPLNLQKIGIQSPQGEITLGRAMPQDPWRILKPLKLPTDRLSMQALIEGLFNLRATKVSDRSEVTLPTNSSSSNTTKITLNRFGQTTPTTLEIYPAESLEDISFKAVVDDRPDTVFELPAKPASGLVSLADLPMDVNSLRDPTLTSLNVRALKSIQISPSTGANILISRTPPEPWMATINQRNFLANEKNLFRLLKAVTNDQVSGFVSDAASDFSPWGLDRPVLSLRFLATNNEVLELRFGMDAKGEFFANRLGTRTVMKVDGGLIRAIAVQAYEWKHARVWSLNRVNLSQLVIKKAEEEPLMLDYDFFAESWKARRNGKDISSQLVEASANFLLSRLEGIESSQWLAKNDTDALAALGKPSLAIGVKELIKDDDDNVVSNQIRTMVFAPATQPQHYGHHYGMILGENHPFLITGEQHQKLTADLLDD